MNISEAVYSEEYINLIVSPDLLLSDEVFNNDDVFYCGILEGNYRILYIKKSIYADFIKNNPLSVEIPFLMFLMGEIDLRSSGILQVMENPNLDLTGNGVIFGIIDTGIDYTNESFIYENGETKILNIWDQTEGTGGEAICYGTEYSYEQINTALKSQSPFSIVLQRDEIGHGTRLAQIASGRKFGEYIGVSPNSEIICVKVKKAKSYMREFTDEDVFCCDSTDVINGVEYIIQKANSYQRPVVILIGMGTNDGNHNGQSYFERYLSNIANQRGVVLCIPAGNEADKAHHSFSNLADDYTDFEIQTNGNRKGFLMNIWSYSANRFSVEVILPTGEILEEIYLVSGFNQTYKFPLSGTSININATYPVGSTVNQRIQFIFRNVIDGIWNIRVYVQKKVLNSMHSWLPVEGAVQGKVSFLNPNPFYTVTTPSTAVTTLSVGGYNAIDNSIYPASGRGPSVDEKLLPDFTAPAVNVAVPSGSITGTSAAAAITAGAAILIMEWGIIQGNDRNINTVTAKSYFIGGATTVNNINYPNNIWGFGKINLYNSFLEIII